MMTSSRKALGEFADTLRAKTRDAGKSSPKDIEKVSPNFLPDVGYSEHFLGSAVALTARPPPTPILAALQRSDEKPRVQNSDRGGGQSTNPPLEDPFDDRFEHPPEINIFEDPDSPPADLLIFAPYRLRSTPESNSSNRHLGSQASDKENQVPNEGRLAYSRVPDECHDGCRVPSLTEPVKHSPPNSPSRRPPSQLTIAKKLPPFQLQANVTSASVPRDTTAFRYAESSEDQAMDVVDEISTTEFSWQTHNATLEVNDERRRTPSPASVPLPETPMPGSY